MNQLTILNLFNRILPVKTSDETFKKMNLEAVKYGYLIHPGACTVEVMQWIRATAVDYNTTFYKQWNDVTNRDRFELLIDQLMHYASTYGTNYEDIPYIPNDGSKALSITNFKLILPINFDELSDKVRAMIYSGVALKENTVFKLIEIIKEFGITIEIDQVKNREAKMKLCTLLNIVPSTTEEMVRLLVYVTTDKTMVIKDKATIQTIRSNVKDVTALINAFGIEKLSEVFYRYKALFLAMRTNPANKPVINRLRKLAKTHHKPYVQGFFEQVLAVEPAEPKLEMKLETLNNFKKISLLQTIAVRQKELQYRPFVVRNQKLYVKEATTPNLPYYTKLSDTIYKSLVGSLSKNACRIKMPTMNIALPISEKSFIGNLPLGSNFNIGDKNVIIGINWRGEDGAQDLDLKYIDFDGNQVGWNASYYTDKQDIIYSGDMTCANPEATELLFAKKGFVPGIIKVNMYNGKIGAKFKLFVAIQETCSESTNFMVDPNNIVFEAEFIMDSNEVTLGVVENGHFTVAAFRTGSGMVARDSVTNRYTQHVMATRDCYLSAEKVLTDAGYIIDNEVFDKDLSVLDRASLIELLS